VAKLAENLSYPAVSHIFLIISKFRNPKEPVNLSICCLAQFPLGENLPLLLLYAELRTHR